MQQKKFALVTGASGGIGREIVKALAMDGYSIYLHYNTNVTAIDSMVNELQTEYKHQEFIPIQADLSSPEGLKNLYAHTESIDCLVHNSGQSHVGLITEVPATTLDEFILLNITHPFLLTQHVIPEMVRKKRGKIIFITSIWGVTGASMEVLYSMVKGAQNSLVKALAKELAPSHITVNAVAPGAIDTPMMAEYDDETLRLIIDDIPAGRLGTPTEIASLVKFLASDEANYINGQVISVNGAWYC